MKTLLLVLILSSAAFAAEVDRPLADLIKERVAAYAEMEAVKKEADTNVSAFNKLPAAIEFNAKQGLLQGRFQKAQAKLNDLNAQIAEKVTKEKR